MVNVSFIVPVYNAEPYLRECLDSIVCQLTHNELILIDDGSTDRSGDICEQYSTQYQEISVIHTENHGASQARNLGLTVAKGVYIAYVDADDCINRDFSARFLELNPDADLVFYPICKWYGRDTFIPMGDGLSKAALYQKQPQEVLAYIARCPKFPASPCGKLVKRSFLSEYGIRFAFDRTGEDYDWTYSLLRFSRSYDFFDGGLYTYRQHNTGRSAMTNENSVDDHLTILRWWQHAPVENSFRQHLNNYLAYEFAMILPFYGAQQRAVRNRYKAAMKSAIPLLRYGKTPKLHIIRAAVTLLGLDAAASILYRYVTQRNERCSHG